MWLGVPMDSVSDPKWSCVVGCESEIGHQEGITCWKEIGLRAQSLLTDLDAVST